MGGYGSGRQGGQGKQTVDRAGSVVDIGNLKIPPDAIEVRIFGRFTWNPQAAVQTITIDWTACNFGGFRPWFLCPECDGRVRKLYQPEENLYYRCRRCCDLTYQSCQWSGDAMGQAKLRVDRLRKKLRAGPLLGYEFAPIKPLWMHQKTHSRLLAELKEATQLYFELLSVENRKVKVEAMRIAKNMPNSKPGQNLEQSVDDFENDCPVLDMTLVFANDYPDEDWGDLNLSGLPDLEPEKEPPEVGQE